jgi:hypothetical protein
LGTAPIPLLVRLQQQLLRSAKTRPEVKGPSATSGISLTGTAAGLDGNLDEHVMRGRDG